MNKIETKKFTDICPISNSKETIYVDYKVITQLGEDKIFYKKASYLCSNENCYNENCPLYNSIANNY